LLFPLHARHATLSLLLLTAVPFATAPQVHEFGHHIHLVALTNCEAEAATLAYMHANASGSYSPESYMIVNEYEYIAMATEAWFQVSCAQQQLWQQQNRAVQQLCERLVTSGSSHHHRRDEPP
jgi:hypothetical protein